MKRNVLTCAVMALSIFVLASCNINGSNESGDSSGTAGNSSSNPAVPPVVTPDTTPPTVSGTYPNDFEKGIAINRKPTITFSEAMRTDTVNISTFSVKKGLVVVGGTVSYTGTTATFAPKDNFEINTEYTVRMTTSAMDLAGNKLAVEKIWTFTTGAVIAAGPAPVNLGTAGDFAILSKSGIDSVPSSAITGNIGVSPAAATYLTGFSLSMDATNTFATSPQIKGKAYASDYTPPCPAKMTTAVSDMEIAYTDAAGRSSPDYTELGAGNISGLTLVPGLYKWGTGLLIATDVTLKGNANDVWIFQISGDFTMSPGAKIILSGGAKASNIFWQSYGAIVIGTTAHLEGVVLSQTEITLATGASANGRLLSQTAVTLDQSTVIQPVD